MTRFPRSLPIGAACLVAACLCLCSSGCFSVKRKPVEKRYFVLEARRAGEPRPAAIGSPLVLRRFRISPRFETALFVYRTGEYQYDRDFYSVFFSAPAGLVAQETSRWIEASGLAPAVVGADSLANAQFAIEGAVNSLFGDYTKGHDPLAVLEMQLFLVDETSPGSRIAFHKSYRRETPAADHEPAALVAAWNKGLSEILTEFEADLAAALAARTAPATP